ncbi:MAG: Fic family protein [Niameybacter sp.]|uniref:Fic family protein n=1 Tax=Niameybacter sp. TaxID=2033640 RepID=UPI002FCC5359
MQLTVQQIQEIKKYPNSIYTQIKQEFLYHSNKIEGSTFTRENLASYLDQKIIEGSHKVDDVFETINSVDLFDFTVDTLSEPLTKRLILEYHRMLKLNTRDAEYGFSGCWKKIPNYISGSKAQVAQPYEVDAKIEELLSWWEQCEKAFEDIVAFHVQFESIHPFQDGNGRVGRFIMLKQCLENGVGLIAIDEKYEKQYKEGLQKMQTMQDMSDLLEVLKKCQEFLSDKTVELSNTIKCLEQS